MIINNLDEYNLALAEEKRLRRRFKRVDSEEWKQKIGDEGFIICNAIADWNLRWKERTIMRKQWAKPLENLIKRLKKLCEEQEETTKNKNEKP